MQNMQSIHETVLRDVVDIAQGLKDSDEVQRVVNYQDGGSWRSIANKADALTLVFPVLASRNISFDAAAMVSKAIERKAVIMLQMLFSAIQISDANNAFDYIKKFHTNLDTGALNVDKFMEVMDDFVEENALITEAAQAEQYEKVKKDMRNMNFYFEFANAVEDSLDQYKVINVEGTQILVNEANRPDPKTIDDKDAVFDKKINKLGSTDAKNLSDVNKSILDTEVKRLLDGEVKKANELVPTMMYINFISANSLADNSGVQSHAVIGIKAKLYAVDSQDILNRLKIKHNDGNTMLNLIKAGTREISFFKDFLFAIDRAKLDAISQSRRGSSSKIWKILERRALKSKIRRSMFSTNDASAISTLVISQEEVEYLKKTEYIDVENPRIINPIMDAYNLMGFVIVDESLDIAKFLFDTGDDIYEVLTFNNLEREQRDNSKKIVNLMAKMAR